MIFWYIYIYLFILFYFIFNLYIRLTVYFLNLFIAFAIYSFWKNKLLQEKLHQLKRKLLIVTKHKGKNLEEKN